MNDWLNKVSDFLQQAWVYIPAILSFITAVGLPSMVQIGKILSSAHLYLTQTKTLLTKFNEVVKTVNNLMNYGKTLKNDIQNFIEDEIKYDQAILNVTVNVKQKKAIQEHIQYLESKLKSIQEMEEVAAIRELTNEEMNLSKKTIKLKVK